MDLVAGVAKLSLVLWEKHHLWGACRDEVDQLDIRFVGVGWDHFNVVCDTLLPLLGRLHCCLFGCLLLNDLRFVFAPAKTFLFLAVGRLGTDLTRGQSAGWLECGPGCKMMLDGALGEGARLL